MLVDLDDKARVRDLYYPYVGQENHVNGKMHKLGIWVDEQFSWFDSDDWQRSLAYKKEMLVTDIVGRNESLGIELHLNDAVHYAKNIFIRKVTVTNLTKKRREVRLFFHQRFEVYESNIGDTVYYHPSIDSIVHYKGKRYFLINGIYKNRRICNISSYTTGLAGEYGLEGTYKDAEDGYLAGNAVEHGSVDSTVSFNFPLAPGKSKDVYYWICVGQDFAEVSDLNYFVLHHRPEDLIDETGKYWKQWVNRTEFNFMGLSDRVIDLFKRSLLIIRTHADNRGAIIASSDSDMLFARRDSYSYMWPRDGALIARSLDRAGYSDITENFFKFCVDAITPEGYLFHKYRPDGSLGSSWHSWLKNGTIQLPIQEDQIGLVLDALWKHFEQHAIREYIKEMLDLFIRKSADFLVTFIDKKTGLPHESYDLWEEKLGIHTFSCAAVYAGLRAAENFEEVVGMSRRAIKYRNAAEKIQKAILKYLYDEKEKRFIKRVYYENNELKKDMTNDASSAYGVFQFKVLPVDDERVRSSMEHFKERLLCRTNVGGYARYEGDYYHRVTDDTPGSPWFITTLWLAEYYIALAKNDHELAPAKEIFEWVADHALPTGALPEQMNPHTGDPLSVTPLTWSHAGYVIAINKYLEKLDALGVCEMCNPPKYLTEPVNLPAKKTTKTTKKVVKKRKS